MIDGKELPEAGESQIAGGYEVDLVNQLPPAEINKTLDFFNIFRKNENEDYIYGQRRERKIGLFHFEPGVHTLRLVCVGSNPSSRSRRRANSATTSRPTCFRCASFPFDNIDDWVKKAIELEKKQRIRKRRPSQ